MAGASSQVFSILMSDLLTKYGVEVGETDPRQLVTFLNDISVNVVRKARSVFDDDYDDELNQEPNVDSKSQDEHAESVVAFDRKKRVAYFIYLIMRDELPFAPVSRALDTSIVGHIVGPVPHRSLMEYSESMAERLIDGVH